MSSFQFYDFFAGVGMAEIGLGPDWHCIFANDVDERKAAIHRSNLDHNVYKVADVTDLKAHDLPTPVDLAWASFPCQDLSLAGWRRGMSSSRSGAFWPFWRLMRSLHDQGQRPPIIVIENVAGLLYGPSFLGMCEALAGLNYQFGVLLMDAVDFVPQSRPRVFVVAVDMRLEIAQFVEAHPEKSKWFTKSVRNAYQQLPAELQARWRWWRLTEPKIAKYSIEEFIDAIPEGVKWHSRTETDHILSMMSENNANKVKQACENPGRSVGFVYRRTREGRQRAEVRFDGISGCLRTPNGGSSRQTVLIVEDGCVRSRLLSPREAARLMGLPDDFVLPDRYNDAYRAMGDGVVVPVVRWLSDHLITPMARSAENIEKDQSNRDEIAARYRASAEQYASQWVGSKS